ncbi:hypothetical protein HYV86_00360 [Candidatus Woesearchaeota archaeon]|nr:hypothetical protein [Candidatus Woesearchaeota archaeon]
MSQKLWFKAKTYGWGWTPVTWQGWVIIAIFIASYTINAVRFTNIVNKNPTNASTSSIIFITWIIITTVLLLWICYKTGEKPGWHWGKK